ncbi:MAG: DUF3862 domain-containing protein [Clostridia bacterium]|nr:DUF3862 domain-containing protein [Clostridia bacterium]
MEEIEISEESEVEEKKKLPWFAICVGVVLFGLVIALIVLLSGGKGLSSSYLNYDNYLEIKTGMSYSQVVNVLEGHEGELDTYSSYEGYTLAYYTWTNGSSTKCIVVGFENGKVITKTQYGLN